MKIEQIIYRELEKCKKDPVYFAEVYMLIKEPLTKEQKAFIRKVNPQNVTDKGKLGDIIFKIKNSTVANIGEVLKQIIKEEEL
jgi:hypothetical protein